MKPEEKDYIAKHYRTTTVVDMAAALKRGAATLYAYMAEQGMEPFKSAPVKREKNHPLRVQNRKLENYHLARKLQRKSHDTSI
jgi:hypothetical protein